MAWLQRVATGRVVLIAGLSFVAFSVVFFNFGLVPAIVETADAPLLDNRFAWDEDDARGFMSALGSEGRRLYAVAGGLLFAWTSRRIAPLTNSLRWIVLLPVVASVLDLVENAGVLILLRFFPARLPVMATALGLVTTTKLVLVNLSFVLAVLGLAVLGFLTVLERTRRAAR